MPFLHTELVLFQPARDVVFGMPIFVGDDSKALRTLLGAYRAPCDDPNVWCAALTGAPLRWTLRVECNRGNSPPLARILTNASGSDWRRDSETPGDDRGRNPKRDAAALEMSRVWWVKRKGEALAITASDPATMRTQAGFWIPCEGAAAFDLSDLQPKPVRASHATLLCELASFEPTLLEPSASTWVDRIIAHHAVIAALQARAECCFAFHVVARVPDAAGGDKTTDMVEPIRESVLANRRGRLIEANLHLSMSREESGDAQS